MLWLGEQDKSQVRTLFEASDIAILCSHQEGFPNALLESMAAGIPSVATSVGGVPEIITAPSLGALVPPHDPTALGQAILDLANDPALRAKKGSAGQKSVLERFNLQGMITRHEKLYKAVMAGPVRDAQMIVDQAADDHQGGGSLKITSNQ